VDVFSPPSDPGPLISHLTQGEVQSLEDAETARRFLMMDEELILPVAEQGRLISAHVPIVYGCSHACTFCIIPSKRGGERSRPVDDIVAEIRSLAKQGVKEITLLGQIVDRYGKDIPDGPNLAKLLRLIHDAQGAEGIERIRFLTSHPNYFGDDLIQTIAELPRVMPHIELPIQAGDDQVLKNMKRGYSQKDYRGLVAKIRERIPGCSIATDIIVGFPGETDEQFMETYRVLSDLKLDVAHLARYSLREGTVATRQMDDNISDEEKMRRFRMLEQLQEEVVAEINKTYLGESVEVLFEEKVKNRWRGRTPTNKIVFVETNDDLRGKLLPVTVTWTGPWSMQAVLKQSAVITL
jgi:tRNA-2-methylthio-N6-dimethylallyladenosine synthase